MAEATEAMMDHPEHQAAAKLGQIAAPVVDVVHGVLLAGMGLVTIAGKQTGRLVKVLIDEGKRVEPILVNRGKQAAESVGEAVSDAGSQMKESVEANVPAASKMTAALGRFGIPSKEEIRALNEKIDALNARLDGLQNRVENPQG